MIYETYGSFRVKFLNDERGRLLKSDSLFLNIYDFWVLSHAQGFMKVNHWYHPKKAKLERVLRKKRERENVKDLPIINVLLRKIMEGELVFDPTNYLDDKEQYFSNLQSWKLNFEKQYLEKYPFLTRLPIRHKKIVRHQKTLLIR